MGSRPISLRNNHRSEFHRAKQTLFLQAYIRTGKLIGAARIANIPRAHHYYWMDPESGDPSYQKRFALAQKIVAATLYDEAYRRAVEGVEKPLLYKGQPVATIREYSDGLLGILLKASDPEAFATQHKVSGNINVTAMPFRLDELKPESQREILAILERDLGQRKELTEAKELLEAELLAPEDMDMTLPDPFEENSTDLDNPLIDMIPQGNKGNWAMLMEEANELGLPLPPSKDWRPIAPVDPAQAQQAQGPPPAAPFQAQRARRATVGVDLSSPPFGVLSGLDPALWLPADGTEEGLHDREYLGCGNGDNPALDFCDDL